MKPDTNDGKRPNNSYKIGKLLELMKNKKRVIVKKKDYERYVLTNNERSKILDGCETFGIITNRTLGSKFRSKSCVLCNINKPQCINIFIDEHTVVDACFYCISRIHDLIKSSKYTFEQLSEFLNKKINYRYKAPILFENGRVPETLHFPPITKYIYVLYYATNLILLNTK